MVLFNYSTKELTAKIVYYGPGLCGKTTNLQWIHDKVPIKNKGKMLSLATETDRTLFFDFLPIEIGTIRGMRTRIQLYTVPGQVFYNATRRMVLKGADALVFVCDSQEPMLEANLESFENMRQNLEANEIDVDEIPLVFQYNKRDLPNALPLEILSERLNPRGLPFFEAVALKGLGVEETLKGVTKLVFKSLSAKYGEGAGGAVGGTNPVPAPRAAAPRSPVPPPPRAAPAPPPRASATIPPLDHPATDPEDLLDQLDLTPEPPVLEVVEPAPPRRLDPRGTLVAGQSEADEIRRRIAAPAPPPPGEFEISLEEIEEEEIEELSLDPEPAPPPPARGAGPARPPAPARPAPGHAAQAVAAAVSVEATVEAAAGEADVTLPLDLELPPGAERLRLNLRLVLNLRRRQR